MGQGSGRFAGKVVLISGTGRGIGRAAALRFAAEAAAGFGGDLDSEAAAATQRVVTEAGGGMSTVEYLDVTDEESVAAWVDAGAREFGIVDVLFNNAGAVRFGPVEEQSFEEWRWTLSAELDSVFLTCKHACHTSRRFSHTAREPRRSAARPRVGRGTTTALLVPPTAPSD